MIKKNSANKVINSHGGADAFVFELFERYYNHVRSNDSTKICYLIHKLINVS